MQILYLVSLQYDIYTVQDFMKIPATGSYTLHNDLDFAAIDQYMPTKIQGVFDGQNKTISNLVIKQALISTEGTSKTGYMGLFSSTENATIQNLIVLNITISVESQSSKLKAGLLFGSSSNLVVSNLQLTGSINVAMKNNVLGCVSGSAQNISVDYSKIQCSILTSSISIGGVSGACTAISVQRSLIQLTAPNGFALSPIGTHQLINSYITAHTCFSNAQAFHSVIHCSILAVQGFLNNVQIRYDTQQPAVPSNLALIDCQFFNGQTSIEQSSIQDILTNGTIIAQQFSQLKVSSICAITGDSCGYGAICSNVQLGQVTFFECGCDFGYHMLDNLCINGGCVIDGLICGGQRSKCVNDVCVDNVDKSVLEHTYLIIVLCIGIPVALFLVIFLIVITIKSCVQYKNKISLESGTDTTGNQQIFNDVIQQNMETTSERHQNADQQLQNIELHDTCNIDVDLFIPNLENQSISYSNELKIEAPSVFLDSYNSISEEKVEMQNVIDSTIQNIGNENLSNSQTHSVKDGMKDANNANTHKDCSVGNNIVISEYEDAQTFRRDDCSQRKSRLYTTNSRSQLKESRDEVRMCKLREIDELKLPFFRQEPKWAQSQNGWAINKNQEDVKLELMRQQQLEKGVFINEDNQLRKSALARFKQTKEI